MTDLGIDARVTRRNRRIAVICASVVFGMVGMSYAAVPLYEMFCRVTGFGGTTQRADAAPGALPEFAGRKVTVRFNADVGRGMPWTFQPVQRSVEVVPGVETLVFYRAYNPTKEPVYGQAAFNVTPDKAGIYFDKIACFCFEEQKLEPGESVDMPISFFVDPELLKDPKTRDVHTITLSYTFFRTKAEDAKSDGRTVSAGTRGAGG